MSLPFFYVAEVDMNATTLVLKEDTSKHVVQVLRMKVGEQLQLTDGKGNLITTEITRDHKKQAEVKILSSTFVEAPEKKVSIAISPVKNSSRFEWFLEKATEIGVNEIYPLLCARTEKQHIRLERLNGVLISAMLQSQQSWLPVLHEPTRFEELVVRPFGECKKFIAHCLPGGNKQSLHHATNQSLHQLILIGPEGDFTKQEIDTSLQHHFIPVTLGETRLRTETAGMVAATLSRIW